MNMNKLKYSKENAKLAKLRTAEFADEFLGDKRKIYSLDLLSGYSCPFAKLCLSKVVKINDRSRIQDGKDCQFRCFSASQEVMYPNVYNARKHNFDLVKGLRNADSIADLIQLSMPKNLGICRLIHLAAVAAR